MEVYVGRTFEGQPTSVARRERGELAARIERSCSRRVRWMEGSRHLEWRVGDVIIRRVEARVTAVPHGSICSGVTPEVVDQHRPWIDPFVTSDGRMLLSIHSFVVTDGPTTLVIDTCVGAHGDRPLPQDPHLPDLLADAINGGLAAVDVVVCTHLHFDHVGWNTTRDLETGGLMPTFPNAEYLVSREELDGFPDHDHSGIAHISVDPLVAAGCLRSVESDHQITNNVSLVSSKGHSPGHVSVLISSRGERALITGDFVHTPLQFLLPEITADRFDADIDQAISTRRRLIDLISDGNTLILGTHFPPPTAGRINRTADGGITFTPHIGSST